MSKPRIIAHRARHNHMPWSVDKMSNDDNDTKVINRLLAETDFGVEVDVYLNPHDDKLYLGHNFFEEPFDNEWLESEKLYVHCKNLGAWEYLTHVRDDYQDTFCDFFMHDKDLAGVTAYDQLWMTSDQFLADGVFYTSKYSNKAAIIVVLPEKGQLPWEYLGKRVRPEVTTSLLSVAGIVTDYPFAWDAWLTAYANG